MSLGTLYALDDRTFVICASAEVDVPTHMAHEVLGRPPAITRDDLVSWGRLSTGELERLRQAQPGLSESDRESLRGLFATTIGRTVVWSLCYDTER